MTTRFASPSDGDGSSLSSRGLVFWYQATRMARASASCRYRLGHFAEVMRGATTVVDPRPPLEVFDHAEALVVVRPFVDDACRRVIDRCRGRGIRLVADFDDLLFAGDPADYPLVLSGALGLEACRERIQGYRAGLAAFDAFTVATSALVDRLREVLPDARIACVPNGLSAQWVEQGRALYPAWQPGDERVIRLLAGSPSHDADFAVVEPLLKKFLRRHDDVRLEVVGPLVFSPGSRMTQLPRVEYAELPRLLSSSWATIAPLRPSPFTECKSAIKFLESAAFGAPCVVSPNADMRRHRDGGVLLAGDDEAWLNALSALLDDSRRMELSEVGMRYVDEHGLAHVGAKILYGLVNG